MTEETGFFAPRTDSATGHVLNQLRTETYKEAFERLHANGGVEALIAEGRIPLLYGADGSRYRGGGRLIAIPPVGTTLEDTTVYTSGGGIAFIGLNGERRGSAALILVSQFEAARIGAKVDAALAAPPSPVQ